MSKHERVREPAPEVITPDYVEERRRAGWKLVALEWERPSDRPAPEQIEVPYGWRIASDCRHLEEDSAEQETLVAMMDMIVADTPLSKVASELNRSGHRMRNGSLWSAPAVFNLLPRLVETGPRLFGSEAWTRRHRVA